MVAPEPHLRHHGDVDVEPGLVDLAVNVRAGTPPAWLRAVLEASLPALSAYPDATLARHAIGQRHGRPDDEVLPVAGAAEAFVLVARALRPRRAVVVHPQFTEPEAALRAAGHLVDRLLLDPPFTLDPADVPADADLVMLGNPTNPTSVLHPTAAMSALCRPGRVLVVDEAFMDAVPGEPQSLAARRDLPGLVVVRSLTKTWGLAGLRVGYVLASRDLVALLAAAQPLWAVSGPALAAAAACCGPEAVAEADAAARCLVEDRRVLVDLLGRHAPAVQVAPDPRAPFVLLQLPPGTPGVAVRAALRSAGWAVRRGDTFPGLGDGWLRVAVRDRATSTGFVRALADAVRTRHPLTSTEAGR